MKTIALYLFLFFKLTCFQNAPQNQDPIPKHDTFKVVSKAVAETRTINVWTPEEYTKTSESLPVLYMLDGGIKEDFPHIANTLSELIKSKKIKPIILVGIENTKRRRDLTGPTEVAKDKEIAPIVGGSEKFRAFVNDELFAEINKRYRTNPEKGIIGESLAGLFVVETFLTHPEMFDFYIAFDPSLWWNNQYLVKTAKQQLAKFPTEEKRLWFAGSDAEDIHISTRILSKTLESENSKNLKWHYSDEPKEQHTTVFRATKVKALEWSLNR
ncbi:putative alpha/beta superfamily hydrolase [Flavobacterium arsenatis]|uniref:Alpha/beta superfamily hydrolase n=1 Tax=Flavobacterium arsenatis TaxID=1484332 RepID=A0ABU1TPA3_9FLAO|nr:alpha/beta hydrolase-fold protein [Flavobacterium arsenatis]MDR6967786.1 putative alpha/beta superfamily hydrolase [Flavobacterium arsenatis]